MNDHGSRLLPTARSTGIAHVKSEGVIAGPERSRVVNHIRAVSHNPTVRRPLDHLDRDDWVAFYVDGLHRDDNRRVLGGANSLINWLRRVVHREYANGNRSGLTD